MRVAHYLIRGRSGLFYFRLRVPADLRESLGRLLIKRATGTRCPRAALAVAVSWAAVYAQSFRTIRRGEFMAKPPSVEDLLQSFERGDIREWLGNVSLPNGARIDNAKITSEKDARLFGIAVEDIGRLPPGVSVPAHSAAPVAPAPAVPKLTGITLAEAVRKWHTAIRVKNKQEKTRTAKKAAAEGFEKWKQGALGPKVPPVLVENITRTDCSEWFIFSQGAGLTARTIENKFIYLAGFFDWAIASRHYPPSGNPARGHASVAKKVKRARAKSHGWQAFTPDQLAQIFHPADYASMDSEAARWIPLMALYTGARSNELGRLEIADCVSERDGTPVFDFNLLGDHKGLKTEPSDRKTPVHPDLIALGLWERVERLRKAGEVKLFPELTFTAQNGPANGPQRAFSRYLKRLKISARGGGKVGHHSFRDTVIDIMKVAGVPRELREEYTGHERSQRPEHSDAYEIDAPPAALAKACHPSLAFGLDLAALRLLLR